MFLGPFPGSDRLRFLTYWLLHPAAPDRRRATSSPMVHCPWRIVAKARAKCSKGPRRREPRPSRSSPRRGRLRLQPRGSLSRSRNAESMSSGLRVLEKQSLRSTHRPAAKRAHQAYLGYPSGQYLPLKTSATTNESNMAQKPPTALTIPATKRGARPVLATQKCTNRVMCMQMADVPGWMTRFTRDMWSIYQLALCWK